jgi:hypothetical protein
VPLNHPELVFLSRDLIQFLRTAEPEFREQCSSNMMIAAEQYSPNRRWHIDTVFDVLKGRSMPLFFSVFRDALNTFPLRL